MINRGHAGLNYLQSVTLRKSQRDSDEFGRRLHALLSLCLCHNGSKRMLPAEDNEGDMMLARRLLSSVNIQSIFFYIILFPCKVNLNFILKPLCLSLQWIATRARLTPVSTEGAVCRKVTAIAATVLRASLEKAARSVSHWPVSA